MTYYILNPITSSIFRSHCSQKQNNHFFKYLLFCHDTIFFNSVCTILPIFWSNHVEKSFSFFTSFGVFICVLVVELNKHQIFSNMSPILSTITVFILIKHLMSVRRAFMTLKAKPLKVKFLVALNSKNFAFELTHFPYHRLFRFFYKDWASMSSNSSFPAFNYCGKNWSESDLHILINSWCLLGKIYVAIF